MVEENWGRVRAVGRHIVRKQMADDLATLIDRERPTLIAAAWKAWRVRHKGSIGPGPAFVEAIDAILATLRALQGKADG